MEYKDNELIISREEMSRAIIAYAGRQVKVLGLQEVVPRDAEINIDMVFTEDGDLQGCVIKFFYEDAEFTEIKEEDKSFAVVADENLKKIVEMHKDDEQQLLSDMYCDGIKDASHGDGVCTSTKNGTPITIGDMHVKDGE